MLQFVRVTRWEDNFAGYLRMLDRVLKATFIVSHPSTGIVVEIQYQSSDSNLYSSHVILAP